MKQFAQLNFVVSAVSVFFLNGLNHFLSTHSGGALSAFRLAANASVVPQSLTNYTIIIGEKISLRDTMMGESSNDIEYKKKNKKEYLVYDDMDSYIHISTISQTTLRNKF